MKTLPARVSRWSARASLSLIAVGVATQGSYATAPGNPNLQRHWDAAFDVALPAGVSSEELGERCWTQRALNSYVTQGRLWIEDVYELPYGYVGNHCLREQLAKANSALNTAYQRFRRSLEPAKRAELTAAERMWIVQRNDECNVRDGVTYAMLGSFVCLMNMTTDRIRWINNQPRQTFAKSR